MVNTWWFAPLAPSSYPPPAPPPTLACQVSVMESGEHVVAAAGEVHLETVIKDLRERFAKIELRVGARLL